MKLINNLGTRVSKNNKLESWGLFLCPYCNKIIERLLSCGKKQKSCGCIPKNKKHGSKNTRLYTIWVNMKQRCLNLNHNSYKNYGGRGITICNEWLEFIPFRDWALNNGYVDNLTIDRKDPNKGYHPNNCQWILGKENSRKQRTNKLTLEKANEIRELDNTGNYKQKDLAEKFNISHQHISSILNNKKWSNIK